METAYKLDFPRLLLGTFPTPVERLAGLERELGTSHPLYVKRDDLTATSYGGNKVRKLEFLLGKARAQEAKTVITVGAAGSHHAFATAFFAALAGLKCHLVLVDQSPLPDIGHTLLADIAAGAVIHHCPSFKVMDEKVTAIAQEVQHQDGVAPLVIPAGGSSPTGTLGYVHAGFELSDQLKSENLPIPERIFLPLGSMGTAAGLSLALSSLEVPATIVGVRVIPGSMPSLPGMFDLFDRTKSLCIDNAPELISRTVACDNFIMEERYLGPGYGEPTEASNRALRLAEQHGLRVDTTYSAKAFAAFCDAAESEPGNDPLLFWLTLSKTPPPLPKIPETAGIPPSLRHHVRDLEPSG